LVPADALVYLETNDLGAALQTAKPKSDVASLNGVQLAIAITGIETAEQKLSDTQSNAQIKPKFVAVADTHTWNFYAVRFAEEKLGAFVEKVYGSKPTVDEPEHPGGGRDIVWTAADGRKAYAFVAGSIVYFSNDRDSLDKCLTRRDGHGDNLSKAGKVPVTPPDALASGYISTPGVAQLADLEGIRVAASSDADPKVKSIVAAILPQIIREMVTDITWTAKKIDTGVEDTYQIRMPDNVAAALKGTRPVDLDLRLRNMLIALLSDSKLDTETTTQVADVIAAAAKPSDSTKTHFSPTGMERATTSDNGLIAAILAEIVTQ
ncbi:MAG: hypothetical protein JO314_08475, partial [Acidobacteria bacterium]|nr:hypothetical protein [Acidobacteriota bacterium]